MTKDEYNKSVQILQIRNIKVKIVKNTAEKNENGKENTKIVDLQSQ